MKKIENLQISVENAAGIVELIFHLSGGRKVSSVFDSTSQKAVESLIQKFSET